MIARVLFLLLLTCILDPLVVRAALGGRIALYSDAGLSECSLKDTSPGAADVYVVHRITGSNAAAGVTGVMFALVPSPGFSGTWIEDIVPLGLNRNGTSPTGIGVGYSTCRFGDLLVLQVRYQMQGTSSSCSFLEAIAYPSFPWILTTTCGEGDPIPVDGTRLMVNANQSCLCEGPLAVESSTWGRIKAMYKD